MKTWQKVGIGVGAVVVLGSVVLASYYQANKGVETVQSGQVTREDLTSVVTASGEIRPKNYTNVLGEGIGKITDIVVKEGDHVKKGDVLLRLESIQPGADVEAQSDNVQGTEAGMKAASANYDAAVATLSQRQSDLEKAKLDWARSQSLYKEELIAKSDYDAAHASYESAVAALGAASAQVEQTRAAREQARLGSEQARAVLTHQQDVLRKTTYRAPIDGIVSYIAVRVGENVVPGIQNAEGSFLMTISDMSVVTAEVKVDETDITNVRPGDPADVTIDAVPGKTFKGHVSQVGELAILRSSGQAATTQTTANTQEARDFKVVVTLDTPLELLRPGLSSTAKIQTAQEKAVLTIPIQALAVRSQEDLDTAKHSKGNVTLAASKPAGNAQKTDIQGVFVIRANKAEFVPVQTGITGITDIEITSGLKEGDQIVTGSYKVLRTLRPGTGVKVDNSAPKHEESSS
ncbi:MAG TPA: efflux RND transporter periplasmic adaptor subunit [Candidatus Acidoferrales bacterium]|nr:efflux RND transporter periplasmic adaptor subunit [Candidatus Acidoferrales bacterium]